LRAGQGLRTLLDAQAGDGADAGLPRGELKASHGREGKARAENGAPKGGIAGLGKTIAFYENENENESESENMSTSTASGYNGRRKKFRKGRGEDASDLTGKPSKGVAAA